MSMGVSPGRGLRVLMAEDEWLAAEVLAEGLADAGFTVLTRGTGWPRWNWRPAASPSTCC